MKSFPSPVDRVIQGRLPYSNGLEESGHRGGELRLRIVRFTQLPAGEQRKYRCPDEVWVG
jgi:hypothetical protein